jgi:hypothetical protein
MIHDMKLHMSCVCNKGVHDMCMCHIVHILYIKCSDTCVIVQCVPRALSTFDGDFIHQNGISHLPANIASQNWKINDTCLENRAKVAKAAFAHFCGFTKLQPSIFQFCDAMFAGRWFWTGYNYWLRK